MTEENNPPTPGIILFLGKREQQRRAFHIPTAPAARLVSSESKSERSFLYHHPQALLQAHSSIGKHFNNTVLEQDRSVRVLQKTAPLL